jgi:hypothetical protein
MDERRQRLAARGRKDAAHCRPLLEGRGRVGNDAGKDVSLKMGTVTKHTPKSNVCQGGALEVPRPTRSRARGVGGRRQAERAHEEGC